MATAYAPSSSRPPPARPLPQHVKEPVTVVAVPSVTVISDQLVTGDAGTSSTRSYTPLKDIGGGSLATLWLCDWHGTLPPNAPLSAMQCGPVARPEYAAKRLVVVKRIKKRWKGGWDECKKFQELESSRSIPHHPNIISLYDSFFLPSSKELYLVFEAMEGNLHQLIKARKGVPFAGGLVASIFHQTVSGLHHVHISGYFHRDVNPDNLLVITAGHYNYRPVSPVAPPDAPSERDLVVIIKLADFGLAQETKGEPPHSKHAPARWYRAPEVILRDRDYSNPVDLWALGTTMAEVLILQPLFPGRVDADQLARICDLLGDPSDEYGQDYRGRPLGGGAWPRGIEIAGPAGFAFPKTQPKSINAVFDRSVPVKLVECITDLLRYNPDTRLTARQCLDHPYLAEAMPKNNPPIPVPSFSPPKTGHSPGVVLQQSPHVPLELLENPTRQLGGSAPSLQLSLIEAVLSSEDEYEAIRRLRENDAQVLIDTADQALHQRDLTLLARKRYLRLLYRACGHHALLPKGIRVSVRRDRTGYPLYRGGYGDVWKGEHRGQNVAVKVIRLYTTSDLQKVIHKFYKEVVMWRSLQHPNVLPLIGVIASENEFAMVSDWMINGNINEYVKAHPEVDRLMLLTGVPEGLVYIHNNGMIHGDLKGANILIDETGHPRLADFGLLTIISDPENRLSASSTNPGGTFRWMSPELIAPEQFGIKKCCPTEASDCYALGMVIYETISGDIPFRECADAAVCLKVMAGNSPARGAMFSDRLWELLELCWAAQPEERPSVEEVSRRLNAISNLLSSSSPGSGGEI